MSELGPLEPLLGGHKTDIGVLSYHDQENAAMAPAHLVKGAWR